MLVIGFGRFGQVVSQLLLPQGIDVTTIDNDVDMIEAAERFGFKVYYGDGTRLDVLRAAGAATADVVLICVDDKVAATKIAELVRSEFPLAKILEGGTWATGRRLARARRPDGAPPLMVISDGTVF